MKREKRLVAAAIQDRGAFSSIAAIASEEDFSRKGWLVWQEVENYYNEDREATNVSVDIIRDSIKVSYPKHFEQFYLLLDEAESVSVPNAVKEYFKLKEEGVRQRLSTLLLSGGDRGAALELMEDFKTITDVESDEETTVLCDVGIDSIIDVIQPENIISVHPPALAERLDGGFVPGNQFVIYANTEVGKSLLAIAMTCGWLRDGRKVLYVGNEDAAKLMILRVYSNLAGMTKHEILASPRLAEDRARAEGYGLLHFMDATPGTIAEVRRLVEKIEPEIVMVDQMANMEHGKLGKVEKNEELAVQLRKLAKRYGHVSGIVHQADDAAYGKLTLDKNNMHYSNIGVQGQMDVMIGMGMNGEFEQQNKRMLTLTKNKISGNHSFFAIDVIPELSEVKA